MMSTQATAMIYLTWIAAMPTVAAFSASNFPRKVQHLTQAASSYGRGAEIWPECNENQVSLSDSFPGGIVPSQVAKSLTFGRDYVSDTNLEEISSNEPRTIRHVLSRITDTHSSNYDHVEKAHFLIMMFLLFNGLIGPQDIIVAAGLGGYLSVLYFWARSPRSDGFSPIVPKLPPQGHVPDLVHNPLGLSFTCSSAYNTWLKIGTFIGVLTPMLVIFKSTIFNSQVSQIGKASWCARPLFFFCCQSLIESRFRQRMVSLMASCRILQINIAKSTILS